MIKIRWRIRVWFPDNENPSLTRFRYDTCKLCVARLAESLAKNLTAGTNGTRGTCTWTVDKMSGHLQGWQVVVHSGMVKGSLLKRHEHRESERGTVGADGDSGGLERKRGTG